MRIRVIKRIKDERKSFEMGSGGSIGEGGENKGNIIEVEFNLQRINTV